MARTTRVNFLARRSISSFLLRIQHQQPDDWPPHLYSAQRILHDELNLPKSDALAIILKSVAAANDCVTAENRQVDNWVQAQAKIQIGNACRRISKCINRCPAVLRQKLDQAILPPLTLSPIIDLEIVESIFDAAKIAFEGHPPCEPSSVALASLEKLRQADYATLGMALRQNVERAIAALPVATSAAAANVFATIAATVNSENTEAANMRARPLRLRFLVELAEVWRQGGLKPSRALHPEKRAYKSCFHRYAELVLTAMAEPWAERHSNGAVLDTLREDLRVAHARLPAALRPQISAALRRADREWLIADEYLRDAL
jgi:hypothetical protein